MSTVDPFRLTPEDLPDLDSKTREGIMPLLDALNATLLQLVNNANTVQPTKTVTSDFTSGADGTAYVNIAPAPIERPYSVELNQIRRSDGEPMTAVYSYNWQLTTSAARMTFAGLDGDTDYRITVTLK